MRKPLFVLITDTHLKRGNELQVIDIFKQAIEKTKNLDLSTIYFAGDWFDSRKYQGLSTLKATIQILNMCEEAGIIIRAIPGNHDKPNYKMEDSYLDVFEKYPSLHLVTDFDAFDPDGEEMYWIHMIPFFDEKESYVDYLEESFKCVEDAPDYEHILITHIAVNGVRNNDGSTMDDVIGPKILANNYDLVLVGHYHDYQELENGKIIYVGSTHQHNFGEDELKGMTVVYDDLTLEQFPFKTTQFKMVQIDLNTVPEKEVKDLTKKYSNSEDNVRFKFTGAKEKLKSIDKNKFKKNGIDVKVKADEVDVDLSYIELEDFKGFDPNTIIEEWDDFAKKKELDKTMAKNGRKRLVEVLVK